MFVSRQVLESGTTRGSEKADSAKLCSYALSEGAALAVVSNDSSAVFVLINARYIRLTTKP